MAGPARARALKYELPLFIGEEAHTQFALSLLWDGGIDSGAEDPEPVIGVVAGHDKFDEIALPHRHLGRIESETLGNQGNNAVRFARQGVLREQRGAQKRTGGAGTAPTSEEFARLQPARNSPTLPGRSESVVREFLRSRLENSFIRTTILIPD